jgi:exonuclease III
MNSIGPSYADIAKAAGFAERKEALPYVLTLNHQLADKSDARKDTDRKVGAAATLIEPGSVPLKMPSKHSFTVGSYNIGGRMGLNGSHYDRAAAACLGKVMSLRRGCGSEKERSVASRDLETIKEIQELGLKWLFAPQEVSNQANQTWMQKRYSTDLRWYFKNGRATRNQDAAFLYNRLIGPYRGERNAFSVNDTEVREILNHNEGNPEVSFPRPRLELSEDAFCKKQLRNIFSTSLRKDIICIQEANWIDHELFVLSEYDSIFTHIPSEGTGATSPPKAGIAWNNNRFKFIKVIENVAKRAIAVQLQDKRTGKTLSVASAHISGCHPFYPNQLAGKVAKVKDQSFATAQLGELTESKEEAQLKGDLVAESESLDTVEIVYDSTKGDNELRDLLEKLHGVNSDMTVIGADLNTTALHPRMSLLKDFGYELDYTNHLYPTSTNPNYCLDTRIDWIAVKKGSIPSVLIENTPMEGVLLNDVTTNVSDHRPIASRVTY